MTDETIPVETAEPPRSARAAWRAKLAAHPRVCAAAGIALGALALTAPILVNGRPFPFTDTATYFQIGYAILHGVLTDQVTPISDFSRAYLGARSPYYGVAISLLELVGTFWLVVALNALTAAAMLRMAARVIAPARSWSVYGALIAVLTLASALPLFVGFVMPDIGAAFLALSIGLLVFYPERLSRWERVFAWILLVAALSFHTSHVMLALVLIPAALCLHAWLKAPAFQRRARSLTLALVIGIASWGVFYAANAQMKAPFASPPFLTARVLADGPGKTYLRAACAKDANAYALCQFRNLPLDNTDQILWAWHKDRGVFAVASKETRLAVIREQSRFVLAAIASDPLGEIWAATKNFGAQLVTVGVDEGFKLDAHYWMTYPPDFYLKTMAIRVNLCPAPVTTCPARLPLEAISLWHLYATALTTLYLAAWIGFAFAGGRLRDDAEKRLFVAFAGALVFAVIANAAICGVLSGPFARYQARIVWLIPMLAVIAEMRFPLLTAPLVKLVRRKRET